MKSYLRKSLSMLLGLLLIAAMIPLSVSADSDVVSYVLTGNTGAVITMAQKIQSVQLSGTASASAEYSDSVLTVTAKDGAVGTIVADVDGTEFEIPVGYTTFILDNDKVTVYEGKDTKYEVYGILAGDDNDHTLNKTQNDDGAIVYTSGDDGSIPNINIKKAGGTYVFSGSSDNMSITVNKGAEADANILLAELELESKITAPITVKKESTAAVYIKALSGTTSTLSDADFNNADTYGSTEDGGDGTNANYAESAVIKGKANSNITLTGKGTLNINCAAKNAVKVGEYGKLTVEKLTLNVTSAKNGLSCDNELVINSGTLNITANGGDAVRSDPDAVNPDAGCKGCITINGGEITLKASSDGIQAAQDVNIYDGSFDIATGSGYNDKSFDKDTMSCKGIKASFSADSDSDTSSDTSESTNTINIYGGSFKLNTADDAVHSDGFVNIMGGIFDIYTGDDGVHADTSLTLGEKDGDDGAVVINVLSSYEGLEAGNVYIYSGTYNVNASDDGINAADGSGGDNFNPGGGPGGGNFGPGGGRPSRPGDSDTTFTPGDGGSGKTDFSINVYGGNVYVNSGGDGIDSNGTINFEGGTIIVWGQEAGHDNSPIDLEGAFYVKGATVFAAGGNQMREGYPSNDSQSYIVSQGTAYRANSVINVTDASNNVVFSAVSPKYVNWILYSSPDTTSSFAVKSGTAASTFTVTFDENGHGTAPSAQSVNLGGFVTRPTDPTADGFDFVGWFTDKECTSAYDFSSTVKSDLTLYASWKTAENTEDSDSDTDTTSDTDTSSDVEDEGYPVTFIADNATVSVYYTQDYTKADEENVTTAYSRDADSGKKDSSGSGQVNFKVEANGGYFINGISVEGGYKNLKEPSETGAENVYRLTKITGAVTVTITTEMINITDDSDTDTSTPSETEDNGYKVTFNADHAVINVYYTQDYTKVNEENVKVAYSRNGDTGVKDSTGGGQVNFSVTAEDGYKVTGVSAKGNFNKLKSPKDLETENIYRLTKITGESEITVMTEAIGENTDTASDSDTGTDTSTPSETEDNGYKVTFNADHAVINIYYTQDYTKANEENVKVAYSRNGDTGAKDSTGDGQVNFSVTAEDGYKVTGVSAEGNFNKLKSPKDLKTENIYRLTKITGDSTITVTTEYIGGTTDSDTITDTSSDTNTDSNVDTSTETNTDSNVDTSTDTNSDTGTDSNVDTSTDTGSDTGTDSNVDTSTETDSDTNTESNVDTSTDTSSDTETNDTPKRMYGDVDGDGKITAKDSMLIQRYVIKLKKLDGIDLVAADVNGDGKATNKDALEILRYTIKMSKNERIGTYIV